MRRCGRKRKTFQPATVSSSTSRTGAATPAARIHNPTMIGRRSSPDDCPDDERPSPHGCKWGAGAGTVKTFAPNVAVCNVASVRRAITPAQSRSGSGTPRAAAG